MSSRVDELKSDVEELTRLQRLTASQRVKDILSVEIRKLETEIVRLNEQVKPTSVASGSPKIVPPSQRCYDVKLTNYAWDQSDKFVKLFVTLKNVQSLPAEEITCTFNKRSVELKVNGLDNRNYILTINNLMKDIDESTSHWKVKTDRVVVFLSKAESSSWSHLTASEAKVKDSLKSDLGDDVDTSDPSGGLMNLMKKMYNEGDDEMKRTIAKAWTEGRDKKSSTLDF